MSVIQPLLTIAIPTWNRAHFLERCLTAVSAEIAQLPDPKSVEVLVLDNGSDDATPAVCSGFARKIPVFRCLRHPQNLGVIKNWLAALMEPAGQFVQIFGDDDEPAPQGLNTVLEALCQNPDAAAFIFDMSPPSPAYRLTHSRRTTCEEAARDFFYFCGNAGVFVMRSDLASRCIQSRPANHPWTCWLQTEVLFSVAAMSGGSRPFVFSLLPSSSSPHHADNTLYTSFYLWHTTVRGLAATALNLAQSGLEDVGSAALGHVAQTRRMRSIVRGVLVASATIDTPGNRRAARESMIATLALPSVRLRLWTALALLLTTPSQSLLRPIVHLLKRLRGRRTPSTSRQPSKAREYGQDTWE